MSLSGKPKIEQIDTLLAIAEIAEGISILSKDPKALNKLIKEAYELTEDQQKKIDDANVKIDEYLRLASENKKTLSDIESKTANLMAYDSELKQIKKELSELEASLNKRMIQVKKDEEQNAQVSLFLEGKEKSLVSRETILEDDIKKLRQEQELVSSLQNSLKTKAEQLKGLTEGL